MRIVIVDDEPLVRIGIKSSFGMKEAGIEIVGEAADGEEALRLIAELKPDVVLLDIKMPKKDGIEVLTEIRKQGLSTKVIILSSFDDFIHVKQALKLGAVDYFHKPSMNVDEVISVLNKLNEEFTVTGEQSATGADNYKQGKEDALRQLLTGHGQREQIGLTGLPEGNLYVVLFTVKLYAQIMKRYAKESSIILPNTIRHLLSEILVKECEAEFVHVDENRFAVIFGYSQSKSVQAAFSHVNDMVVLIHSSLKRFVNIDTVFGISEPFHLLRNVPQAFQQAKQALETKFYQPDEPLFYYRPRQGNDEQLLEQLQTCVTGMKSGLMEQKYERFAQNMQGWEQLVEQHELLTERDVKKTYEGLLFMFQNGEDYWMQASGAEDIESFQELSAYYHKLFNVKLKEKITGFVKEYNPLVRRILQYLETNYKEPISLKMLGDLFQNSPNYISRLFKQEVNRGLFDYLNEVRIEKAKELLKDSNYKIYEVAEMVGFKSQVHFAIVFQKYVGMAPKDYRRETG